MSNPNEVKRYDYAYYALAPHIAKEGRWVEYSDFHRFETLADTLADNYNAKHKQCLELLEKVQSLELENKRLRDDIESLRYQNDMLAASMVKNQDSSDKYREALDKYGKHFGDCDTQPEYGKDRSFVCTCGFKQALDHQKNYNKRI